MYSPYLAICSMFRDSQLWHGHTINQVDRYFEQLRNQSIIGDVYCLEGNSRDNTAEKLTEYARQSPSTIFLCKKDNKNNTAVKSTSQTRRIINLSRIANHLLDRVYAQRKYDYILWIESDIIIKDRDKRLIERLFDGFDRCQNKRCGMVAPLVFMETRTLFYDVWGFTGKNSNLVKKSEGFPRRERYYQMDSVGTCALFYATLNVNFGRNGFQELSRQVRGLNFDIYADTEVSVYHPSKIGCIKNRWI